MIGQPVRRKEDRRLLTGAGRYSDDVNLPGQAFAAMVRSPHAHARIRGIDTGAARAAPGVLAVLTGTDCRADRLNPIPHGALRGGPFDLVLTAPGGGAVFEGPQVPLPADKARHAGEAVAMVVAETAHQARDAAETVAVDWQVLPAVTDSRAAAAPGAPSVWDEVPDNVCVDCEFGDAAATEAAFAAAAHVVEMTFHIPRVTGVPMEPRAALGVFDPASGRYTLHAGSGGTVRHKKELAAVLGVVPDKVRVVACDVGGNYGTRNRLYVEFVLVAWAARRLGRPVKWTAERSESFLSDVQGRDLVTEVALALDAEGAFLALRASNLSNVGARAVSFTPLTKGANVVTGPYAVPAARVRTRAVFTNTPPTNPYRSAGRPEVIYALERLIDTAARELGFDRIELRRRNLVPPERLPYTNPLGKMTYDSGTFAANMDRALALADWDGFPARKAAARARGRRRGIGLANYLEMSAGAPRERAEIAVDPARCQVEVVVGTQSTGQGHETSYAQVAAEWLGVPLDAVAVIEGDTDVVKEGGGSHSGRSMRMAGTVIVTAAEAVIAKGRRLAAQVLEAAADDIAFADGTFTVVGTDRAIDLFALAAAARRPDLPADLAGGLAADAEIDVRTPVFPTGCHVCEVEIDPETGAVALVRYTAVDDVGRIVNPLIVDGQIHGGIVQGVGEALLEECVCDPETGQPVCGSFMDYAMPRADDLPSFVTACNEVPCGGNPLGVKSAGESGTPPALGVVINAVVDALGEFAVRDIAMPATPLRVWQMMRAHGTNGTDKA